MRYILENKELIKDEIKQRQKIVKEELALHVDGLIVPILIDDNLKVIEIKAEMKDLGYAIGGIRQPTVPKAIVRLIARLGSSTNDLRELCKKLAKITKWKSQNSK